MRIDNNPAKRKKNLIMIEFHEDPRKKNADFEESDTDIKVLV